MINNQLKITAIIFSIILLGSVGYWLYQTSKPTAIRSILNAYNEKVFKPKGWKVCFLKDQSGLLDQTVDWCYKKWSVYDKSLTKEKLLASYKKRLHDDQLPFTMIVLDDNGKMIGMTSLKPSSGAKELKDWEKPYKAWLGTTVVNDNMQKTLLRKNMLELIQQLALQMGYTQLWWYTSDPKNNWTIEEEIAEKIQECDFRGHTIAIMRLKMHKKITEDSKKEKS
ncbi:MAG: hypothetical protein AAF380_02240 [Bacteroidota bacterium]